MPAVNARRRPFRFAVQAAQATDLASWSDLARRAESLGYAVLSMPDHLGDQLAPVPALAAAAAATTSLRIACLVFANGFRHPVVLAKELATLDVLSHGRLEIGLGAGWLATDYEQSGIPYDRPGVRIQRMEEAVRVIRGLMADGPFDFEGGHYRISNLDGRPKPVQRPHPPFVIGGGGRRMLSLAAREADVVGLNADLRAGRLVPEMAADVTTAAFDRKLRWVREAAGDRFDQIELHMQAFITAVTDAREATAAAVGQGFGLNAAQILDIPLVMIGSVDQLVEHILGLRETFGFTYLTVGADVMDSFAPVLAKLAGR